ncbi:hypothetical protein VPH35_129392 [Triticum aestivum]
MQLQLEDERKKKKKSEFLRKMELEQRKQAACMQRSAEDVAQVAQGGDAEGGDVTIATGYAGSHGTDRPMKTNLLQTRLTQVFPHDAVKEKKAVLKRRMAYPNADGRQRRSLRVKAASQPGNSKADEDSVAVKIGPSTPGGSPVRRSPRVLTNKKPSSSPVLERSLLKQNKKRKVPPAKVNKGVKKRARVKAEDHVSEEDDIEVNSEDEYAVIEQDEAATTDSRAGDGSDTNVSDHHMNDVGLERPVVDDEVVAADSRAGYGTEANVSDHHMNDVALEPPVVDETSHNVEAAVDRVINDPSTDKCKGPVVGDEPCSTIGDVPLNVHSSKIDDVAVNAAKTSDVEREAAVSGGDDACGVPLSSGRDVGTKVGDEVVGAASILDAKSSGVGIAGNENLSECEDLPPKNFPPRGLDYGDALQDASSMEEVPSEDDDLLLSISSGPFMQEALVSSQDFLSSKPESATIILSSQDLPSSNPETGGILVSSQELPSSNSDSAGEWLDLGEHDYRIFGSQFSELERVPIDFSQGCFPEKTRSGVMNGRLGALNGSMTACADSPSTPKNTIVELIDSNDDAFDKIAGIGRVTRSAAAKGLSPLAGIVSCRAGAARKDPAWILAMNVFSMKPQPDESVTSFTGKRIWEVFSPGQMMEGDIMDFLIDDWKKDPERNADFVYGKRVLLSPYFITVVVDCTFYGDEDKEFNVESAARDFKSYVKDKEDLLSADLPRIVDWNAEDLYRVVFNRNNHLLVTELPKEVQALAPGA